MNNKLLFLKPFPTWKNNPLLVLKRATDFQISISSVSYSFKILLQSRSIIFFLLCVSPKVAGLLLLLSDNLNIKSSSWTKKDIVAAAAVCMRRKVKHYKPVAKSLLHILTRVAWTRRLTICRPTPNGVKVLQG